MQVLRVRQGPRPARGRQLSESKSLLPSSSLFSGDAFDDVLFHFSAFSDSSDEDRFCRLHLARRFLNQTCYATEDKKTVRIKGAPPPCPGTPGTTLAWRGNPGTPRARHQKETRSRFRIFIQLPGPKAPSSSLQAAAGMFLKSKETQGELSKPGWSLISLGRATERAPAGSRAYLHFLLAEVHLPGQLLAGTHVWVLGLLEEVLQSFELLVGEDGAVPPLPPAMQLVEELQLGARQGAHVHVGQHLVRHRGHQHRAGALVACDRVRRTVSRLRCHRARTRPPDTHSGFKIVSKGVLGIGGARKTGCEEPGDRATASTRTRPTPVRES